jgi:dTDP-4-amino-4,6-dideoxygalactose transaminase
MSLPFFSIDFRSAEWGAYLAALLGGQVRFGRKTDELATLLRERYGSDRHVALLPSARTGFALLVGELFREGDEVIVPAMGFPLYVKILIQHGVRPVFVDVEKDHFTIDCEMIREAVTTRTRGILVTHMFGHPCDMERIAGLCREFGLKLIEDCAQSCGSYYNGRETGTFGDAALVSTSVMKVPTTLGGGVLITPDHDLYTRICNRLASPENSLSWERFLRYYLFGLVSILNSYPALYSMLSHRVFGLMKSRNPHLLRKILYSGLGLNAPFSVWERPRFANYQAAVGCVQFRRAEQMDAVRREYAGELNRQLQSVESLQLPFEGDGCRWNWQYYVVGVKSGSPQRLLDDMFRKGIHLMQEDVWDCTRYPFSGEYFRECPVASSANPTLIRIQNNSLLKAGQISSITKELKRCLHDMRA